MKGVHFLTPIFARMAYEQIEACYKEEHGKRKKMPDKVEVSAYMEGVLKNAGVSVDLLVEAGVVKETKTSGSPPEGYRGDYYTDWSVRTRIANMKKLRLKAGFGS